MAAELKSSDEILQELFGMCSSTKKSIHSSNESSHSKSDVEDDASTKKHKKKKKKHKKLKKRSRSSLDESDSNDHKTHKRKKKKSHKDDDKSKKLKIKIKTEPGEPEESFNDLDGIEKKDSLMDTATGRKLTIDDVFNSLGIIKTEIKKEKGLSPVIKNEENGCDEKQANDSKEAIILPALPPALLNRSPNDKVALKVEKETTSSTSDQTNSTKSKLDDVFDTEPNQLAEKNKSKTKKINIDNLKNSCVYEATIKEVEERERKKAEKYEEGELSSSSNSSQNDMTDDDATETANDTESKKKEKRRHKHKHRSKSKSHERSRSKHRSRSHHSKHGHEKEKPSHKIHRSGKSSVSPPRHSRSTKSHHDHYHHSAHHRSYYSYYSRASSVEGRGSPRSRRSRDDKRGKSSDRSHSRTSKERKSRSKSTEKIDKQKLLEIARKNAITLLKQGALPASVVVNKEKITSIKAGGKTVDELTDFCKLLSKKEAEGQESLSSGSELDEEREKAFHHPFQLKERPSSIVMNIRNAVPLPTKTAQEKTLELSKQLSLQYPVSSGQHHRVTESEWVPVEKTPDPVPAPVIVPPPAPIVPAAPVTIPGNQPYHALEHPLVAYPNISYNNGYTNQIPLPQGPNNDIGSIVAERLEAIRRLTENPSDPIGNNLIQVADTKMKVWAESKVQPGLFTGSTGVRTLSAAELGSGFKAWPKKFVGTEKSNPYVNLAYKLHKKLDHIPNHPVHSRVFIALDNMANLFANTKQRIAIIVPENMLQNQFIVAKPVVSDKGESLMKKMGWQPGEGLGKYKQGPPEPCEIAMKTDRKGLAEQTVSFQQSNPVKRAFELSQNKHPVSLLNEYCSRKKIGVPSYDCEEKEGAGKRKLFLFSVTVKGMTYTPQMPCCNKKQSKIEAATLCLQNLGLLPRS